MRTRAAAAAALAAGSLLLLLLSLLAASGQRVRINEVLLRAGAGGGKGGAFVELQAAANVSVAGWTLRAHDGGSEVQLPKDLAPLAPGALLLIQAPGKAPPEEPSKEQQQQLPLAGVRVQASSGGGDAPGGGTQVVRAPLGLPGNATVLAQLALLTPEGAVEDVLGWVPRQVKGLSWGFPGPGTLQQLGLPGAADAPQSGGRTFLASPTPGAPNGAPAKLGPHVVSVTPPGATSSQAPNGAALAPLTPQPGQPITVEIQVRPNLAPLQEVALTYRVGQGGERKAPATLVPSTNAAAPPTDVAERTYRASIPGDGLTPGQLVRWAALATDAAGLTSRLPAAPSAQASADAASKTPPAPQWFGAVVGGLQDPDLPGGNTTAARGGVPVLWWFTPAPEQSMSAQGAGQSTFVFQGRVYDGAYVQRRGTSSLAWPKPKLKVLLPPGVAFAYDPDLPPVDEFGLQSHFYELGERSYMKDHLGLKVLEEAGAPAPRTFYLHVRLNGAFFGLFSFVEMIDKTFLKRNGIPAGGPLFKSEHGELSNLRWDLAPRDMPGYYSLKYPRDEPSAGAKAQDYPQASEWQVLAGFTQGLAGGNVTSKRSAFVVESLDLPQVINTLAAQIVLNNQDRCTKNFLLYLPPRTAQWLMLPWDLDGALGQDNGLGGLPGDAYCVLACEQWNSPLYCDSEHPQDLTRSTAWGTVTVEQQDVPSGLPPLQASSADAAGGPVPVPGGGRRRSVLQAPAGGSPPGGQRDARLAAFKQQPARPLNVPIPDDLQRIMRGFPPATFPAPRGWDAPDRSTAGAASTLGGLGTFNHLVDAVTDVAATRAMLMRRTRTLAEAFLAGGAASRLAQMANDTHAAIRSLAARDARLWSTLIDVDRGHQQIITEFIPARAFQLLTVYGPNGSYPLLPGPQPAKLPDGSLVLSTVSDTAAAPPNGSLVGAGHVVTLTSKSRDLALDLSSWALKDGGGSSPQGARTIFTFAPGTVLPAGATLHVVPDVAAWQRAHGGQGLFAVGPLKLQHRNGGGSAPPAPASPLQLLDAQGAVVVQSSA